MLLSARGPSHGPTALSLFVRELFFNQPVRGFSTPPPRAFKKKNSRTSVVVHAQLPRRVARRRVLRTCFLLVLSVLKRQSGSKDPSPSRKWSDASWRRVSLRCWVSRYDDNGQKNARIFTSPGRRDKPGGRAESNVAIDEHGNGRAPLAPRVHPARGSLSP